MKAAKIRLRNMTRTRDGYTARIEPSNPTLATMIKEIIIFSVFAIVLAAGTIALFSL